MSQGVNCYLVGLITVACWPQNTFLFFIKYSLFLLKILQSPYLFYRLFRLLFNSSGETLYNRKGGETGIFEWKTQGMKNNGIDIF